MSTLGDAKGDWYWCFTHARPEKVGHLDSSDHMGPYPTKEEAEHWEDKVAARNAAWDAADAEEEN